MKTLLDIAKECGAYKFRNFGDTIDKICFTEAQLTAFIEAWNRQNSEPIYQVNMGNAYYDCDKERYEKSIYGDNRIVYLAPQQPQSVREALEMAAKVCEDRYHFSNAEAIRALIDQPQQPASQELMDYETNAALQNAHEITDSDAYFNARPQIDSNDRRKVFEAGHKKGWQARAQLSKPAKG